MFERVRWPALLPEGPQDSEYDPVDAAALDGKPGSYYLNTDNFVSGPTGRTWDVAFTAVTADPVLSDDDSHQIDGDYVKVGNMVIAWVRVLFGTSGVNAGNGQYQFDLPVLADDSLRVRSSLGTGRIYDTTASDTWLCDVRYINENEVRLRTDEGTTPGNVTHAAPFAWGNSDEIAFHVMYRAAS